MDEDRNCKINSYIIEILPEDGELEYLDLIFIDIDQLFLDLFIKKFTKIKYIPKTI